MAIFETSVVQSLRAFEALETEWAPLAATFRSPLLDHHWFACAAAALHREADLRIALVRQDGVLVAAAPMALGASQRHLVQLGSAALHEPSSWLFASESALRQLAAVVRGLGHPVVLDRLASASPMCRLLPQIMRWRAVTFSRRNSRSFVVPTTGSWETFCSSLSGRTQRKLDGARHRAARDTGGVRFVRNEPRPVDAAAAINRLVEIESQGWKGRNGSALAMRPDLLQFFAAYTTRAAARSQLVVSELHFGDTVAAVEISVEAYGRLWGLKLAYDERFAAYSPALQLVHASIESAVRKGLEAYEFLGAAESWQERWRPSSQEYHLMAVYPLRAQALTTAVRDVAARYSKRVRKAPERGTVTAPTSVLTFPF